MRSKKAGQVIVAMEVELVRETPKAILTKDSLGTKNWTAKSQLKKPTVSIDEDLAVIFIPTWLAEANNWDYSEYDPKDYPQHSNVSEVDTTTDEYHYGARDGYDDNGDYIMPL